MIFEIMLKLAIVTGLSYGLCILSCGIIGAFVGYTIAKYGGNSLEGSIQAAFVCKVMFWYFAIIPSLFSAWFVFGMVPDIDKVMGWSYVSTLILDKIAKSFIPKLKIGSDH